MSGDGPSKTGGKIEEAKGNVREHTAGLFSDKQEAKGKAQAAEGQGEYKAAEAKGWVEGATDSIVGNVKNIAGKVLGDKELEAKGNVQATGGDAKKAANS